MSVATLADHDEKLATIRSAVLNDLSIAITLMDRADELYLTTGIAYLECASRHIAALRETDPDFYEGRDGTDIAAHLDQAVTALHDAIGGTDIAAHLDQAIRATRAAYAVIHMIADKERP